MGQLAQSLRENPSKSFPNDTKKNSKQCMVVTLRSAKELDEPKKNEKTENQVEHKNLKVEEKIEAEENKVGVESDNEGKEQKSNEVFPGRMTFPNNLPIYTPPLPFPQRFPKTKLDKQFSQFLNIFKKLKINIPFADALAQMTNYVKFMEDIMSNKKKLEAYGIVNLTENCSTIIHHKLPEKLKDPGSFTIPCIIGKHSFNKALCDLGVSINLMPFSMAKKLNLGEITLATLSLQMAYRSLTFPKGIIEDVLVKVYKFIFPVDFMVLDMEEDKAAPVILGRPFLATGQALIDVKNGELTPRVGEDQVKFNLYKSMEFPSTENPICMRIDALIFS